MEDSEEERGGEGHTEPFFTFAVDAFAPSEDKFNPWVVEGVNVERELDVSGAEGIEVMFGSRWLGSIHDVSEPVCNRCDGRGEGRVSV
jgi:hypothetical protein